VVDRVRSALSADLRPAVTGLQSRLHRLAEQLRFEEATTIRRRLEALTQTGRRFHRVRSLTSCPQIVAARKVDEGWEIHVIRYGRLAAAALSTPAEVPQAVARAAVATAETVARPAASLPVAGIEEAERIADWLEQPGVRLIEITGDWMWPLHGVLDEQALVRYAGG
jgi:DNA polymerase III subunit epsilon